MALIAGAVAVVGSAAAAEHLRARSEPPRSFGASRGAPSNGGDGLTLAASTERPRGRPLRPNDGKVQAGPPRMMHLDPHHTDRSPFTGPAQPSLAWTFDAGGPIEAAPVALDDGTILIATLAGKLFALDPAGKMKFSVDLGGRAYATPLVTDEGIFAGSDAHRFFGITTIGGIRFRLDTEGDADTGAVPLLDRGLVFASARTVYAAREDGTLLWRVRARKKVFTSPAVADDGTVYFGSQDHRVYAADATGHVRFRVDLDADVDGSPAIGDDGRIFVGTDGREVVALAPEDGAILWRRDVGGFVRGCLSIARDGTVLVGTYGPVPRVVALDPSDGTVDWRFGIQGTGAPEFGIHGGPVEDAQGRLFFGAQDDTVYALDRNGKLLWNWKTGADVDAPIVLPADGILLAGSDDGKLYALSDH